jgi:serine/threonine protein kinase
MGAPVRIGDVLADKYEVTRILGQGGMGVVVAARHRELDKLVALKFMHEEVAANEIAIDRFLREARAAARLRSEHVGHVLDVGRLQNGVPYIVMEYLEGRDLADVAADAGGTLGVADVCEYMLQTCEAMAEAHAQGIIHRDLKPQNLFLTMRTDGRPLIKVLDFGISKVQSSAGPTATQQTMGTPAYMSPEQMRSAKSADARADIWSLGVILYQLLSGTMPFMGDTMAETMLKVMTDELPPLAQARPGLPPALVAAVERCLRKNRDERFNNVAELAHELTPFAPERARAAMSLIERVMSAGVAQPARFSNDDLGSVVPSHSTVAPRTESAVARKPSSPQTTLGGAASAMSLDQPRPSAAKWVAASIVAVAVAVVITVFAVRGKGDGATTPAASPTPDAGITEALKPPPPPDALVEPKPIEAKIETPDEPKPVVKPDPKPPKSNNPIVTRPRGGSAAPRAGSAAGSATVLGGGSATPSTATDSGSATPASGSAGSGSGTKKPLKPVGDDDKPLKPVGG